MQSYNKFEGRQHTDDDEVDRMLDAALAKYAAVAPRAGLEDRILANLHAEQTRVPTLARWRWGVAAVVAAAIVLAAVALRSTRPPRAIANHPPVSTGYASAVAPAESNRIRNAIVRRRLKPYNRAIMHTIHPKAVVAASPKLDQFPSPQPLSEQERIMAGYVASYPEQAALVAEARMEALRRDLEERKVASEDSNSRP